MRVAVVDLETTGFSHTGDVIVEIGIAELNTLTGQVDERLNYVCREKHIRGRHLDAWIFNNSSLTADEVREAPDIEEIRGLVQYRLEVADRVTAFNKKFDFDFLRHRRFEFDNVVEWPCLMLAACPVLKLPHKGRSRRSGYKWPNVEEAWKHFYPDEPYVEQHRGCDDAMHEARIAWALFQNGHISDA